ESRVRQLRRLLPETMRLHYAIKANPFPPLTRVLAGLVDGFDVASAGELRLALGAGMPGTAVSFAGPGKRAAEIAAAAQAGAVLHLESRREVELAARLPDRPKVALRV